MSISEENLGAGIGDQVRRRHRRRWSEAQKRQIVAETRIPRRFRHDPVRDIQVSCPMNRGGVGARLLNIELQAALNPAGERKVERFGWTLAPGDKVMQIENDYDKEVYNGDINAAVDVDPEVGELTACRAGQGREAGRDEDPVVGGRRGA